MVFDGTQPCETRVMGPDADPSEPRPYVPECYSELERLLAFKPGTDFYNGRTAKGRARRS